MITRTQYIIADEQNVYAEADTRSEARQYLKTVKAELGKKTAKIFKEEYALLSSEQVR